MKKFFYFLYLLRKYLLFLFLLFIVNIALIIYGNQLYLFIIGQGIILFLIIVEIYFILKDRKLLRKIKVALDRKDGILEYPKIVAIGGGTGLPAVLQGVKKLTPNIAAVVTMFDDGGSSGKLREQLNILPPGDVRNCLFALAKEGEVMRKLFQYRFQKGDLAGHPVGNILLAAIAKLYRGDIRQGISQIEKVLSIQGKVLPVTFEDATLCAIKSKNKVVIKGESKINKIQGKFYEIYIEPENIKPNPDVLSVISEAEIITLGPGSLFTSIIPNLLIREVAEKINQSQGKVVYICNIMTESGETDGFSVTDHVKAIFKFTDLKKIDYVIYNEVLPPEDYLEKYKQENAYPVKIDRENFKKFKGTKFMGDNLLELKATLRHSSEKLAQLILKIYEETK